MKPMRIPATIGRLLACERGTMFLELGIIATLLTTTALGLAEYAAVSGQAGKLSNAARAGVEYAMKHPADTTGITNVAVQSGNLNAATLTLSTNQFCECPDTSGSVDCTIACSSGELPDLFVTVNLSQPAEGFFHGSGMVPDFTLERSATMRVR